MRRTSSIGLGRVGFDAESRAQRGAALLPLPRSAPGPSRRVLGPRGGERDELARVGGEVVELAAARVELEHELLARRRRRRASRRSSRCRRANERLGRRARPACATRARASASSGARDRRRGPSMSSTVGTSASVETGRVHARARRPPGQLEEERHAQDLVVQRVPVLVAAVLPELLAVVGGEHDQCALVQPELAQRRRARAPSSAST